MKTLLANQSEKLNQEHIINDFSIEVATVNGSGSQSSNSVLMRSLFHMGIPVSGKNLFPSNISGLPTWFTIRLSEKGYLAYKTNKDFLVAMNPQTAIEDVKGLAKNGVCISPAELNLPAIRQDVIHYAIPFNDLVLQVTDNFKLKKLVINMIYVGVVAQILGIEEKEIENSIAQQFDGKAKAIDLNLKAVKIGLNYAQENLVKTDPYRVSRIDKTTDKIIIDGNSACALGAMFSGVSVVTWYPITPSTSVCESLIDYLKEFRLTKDNKATFAVIQAEDELAAIGMAIGAGFSGCRSMTATSGPGLSLMAEFVGFAYFTEIPVVIFDIQRVGPSTGMPTRTSQGDMLSAYYLSHGDTKHICVIPGSVEECYSLTLEAFDLAEQFQTPVFVMSDLDLGMNNWMSNTFNYPTQPLNRGKVLTAKDLEKLGQFMRYKDVDGDGIPYRTLPGTNHPGAGYFVRGSGHTEAATYTEKPQDYVNLMERLSKKINTAKEKFLPKPQIHLAKNAKHSIIGYGSSDFAIQEARDYLSQAKIDTNYLRLRSLPLGNEVKDYLTKSDTIFVIEQNRDSQMLNIIASEFPDLAHKLISIRHFDGLPIDAMGIYNQILTKCQ